MRRAVNDRKIVFSCTRNIFFREKIITYVCALFLIPKSGSLTFFSPFFSQADIYIVVQNFNFLAGTSRDIKRRYRASFQKPRVLSTHTPSKLALLLHALALRASRIRAISCGCNS